MQTLTVEIMHDNALMMLEDMQEKHFIKIIAQPDAQSHVFPGEPFTVEEMKQWVENREKGESMSLETAKQRWAKKEKQLLASVK